MTSGELLSNLRKSLSDIDRARISHVSKKCMLANCLGEWRDAMRRHASTEFIAAALRMHAECEERDSP